MSQYTQYPSSGTAGAVVGPGSSTTNDIPVFADTSGALVADSQLTVTTVKTPDPTSVTLQPVDNSTGTNQASKLTLLGATKVGAPATGLGGDVALTGGTSTATAGQGGAIRFTGGAGSGAAGGGSIVGTGGAAGTSGNGGQITLTGGVGPSAGANIGGTVTITAGAANGAGGGGGGAVLLTSGASTGSNAAASGGATLRSGVSNTTANTAGSGTVTVTTGNVTNSTSNSGPINFSTGTVAGGNTGLISFTTSPTNSTTGNTGAVNFVTGNMTQAASAANCGDITFTAGSNSGTGLGGKITLQEGTAPGGTPGFIQIGRTSTTNQHAINTATQTGAAVGTLTNSISAGNPTGYIKITVNGTTGYIPYWT